MKSSLNFLLGLGGICLGMVLAQPVAAQGTMFTYQGRLDQGGGPANGSYDLTFAVYDNSVDGTQQGATVTNLATEVSNGLFTVPLDFGANFPGAGRWLQISVRTNGNDAFTLLTPRQQITPTPYAIAAGQLTGPLPASQLSGTYPGVVNFSNPSNSFAGNGAGLVGIPVTNIQGLTDYVGGTVTALARTNGSVSILDYGAVSGGEDCYSAFTNAIGGGGHTVMIPAGRFRLSRTVAVPSGTTIHGVDPVNSVVYSTNNVQMFLYDNGASNITQIGFVVEGNWAGSLQYGTQTGVPGSQNNVFINMTFRNLYRGLQLEADNPSGQPYYQGGMVSGCRFYNCSSAGLYINGGAEYYEISGCHGSSNALGLVVYGGNNNVLCNNWTYNVTNVYYKAVPIGNSDHGNFMGNTVNHSISGVGLVTESVRYSMQFQGNYFYDTVNYLSGKNITFAGNTFVVPGNTNQVTFHLTGTDNLRFIGNLFPDGDPSIIATTNSNWTEEGLDSTNGFFFRRNGVLLAQIDNAGNFTYAGVGSGNGSGFTNIAPASLQWDVAPAAFTNKDCARIPVATNAGVVYYLTLSTNAP